jgi:hypothetical protein
VSRDDECDSEEDVKGLWGRAASAFGTLNDIAIIHDFAKERRCWSDKGVRMVVKVWRLVLDRADSPLIPLT